MKKHPRIKTITKLNSVRHIVATNDDKKQTQTQSIENQKNDGMQKSNQMNINNLLQSVPESRSNINRENQSHPNDSVAETNTINNICLNHQNDQIPQKDEPIQRPIDPIVIEPKRPKVEKTKINLFGEVDDEMSYDDDLDDEYEIDDESKMRVMRLCQELDVSLNPNPQSSPAVKQLYDYNQQLEELVEDYKQFNNLTNDIDLLFPTKEFITEFHDLMEQTLPLETNERYCVRNVATTQQNS